MFSKVYETEVIIKKIRLEILEFISSYSEILYVNFTSRDTEIIAGGVYRVVRNNGTNSFLLVLPILVLVK